MDCHRWCERPITPALRAAIGRGWRGVSVADARVGGPVWLVCAVPAARVDALAARGLAIGLPAASVPGRPRGPRRIALALIEDPSMGVTLDLGFADSRALVARIGAEGALGVVWVRAEDARPARVDMVRLPAESADRLRTEAAREGEWRTGDPTPEGFSPGAWRREAALPVPARLVRGGAEAAPVVVVARSPSGPGDEPDPAPAGPADIELSFANGPPVPEAAASIRLRLVGDEQRRLAARLCHQDEVPILLVDRAGNWLAQISLELGWDTRVLIAEALRARAPR